MTSTAVFTESLATLRRHAADGSAGPLHFTYSDPETATDVRATYPWARSLVVFTHAYLPHSERPGATGPVIGRFATNDSYAPLHRIARGVIESLARKGHRGEPLIDDNRLVDRASAARAGVGWLGKSTMLLAPGHGPWLLIGSVATDADLEPTPPMTRGCGTCVACVPACPTGAITQDGLDAGRCISTWLQSSGPIPRWIRPLVERRIYGCDDCLTACPPGFAAIRANQGPGSAHGFGELLGLDDDALIERFGWFYVPHRDPRFLRRNLLVAAGNSEEGEAVGPILDHFTHRSALVRGHAYWAFARSLGDQAWTTLRRRHAFESVPGAIDELEYAMTTTRVPLGV